MRKPELSFEVKWHWGQWVMGIEVARLPTDRPGMDVFVTVRLLPLSLQLEWDSVDWDAKKPSSSSDPSITFVACSFRRENEGRGHVFLE